jgi:transcription elongation factor GreB
MSRYRPPAAQGSKYITPEGASALRNELDRLWRHRRPEVTRALSEAAAEGDRSENAEYIYRKKELREIDRRVRHLRRRLDGIRVVDRAPEDTSRVFFGAWFTLENDALATVEYRLVGPDETHLGAHHISIDSPLGRAIRGKSPGDRFELETPSGTRSFKLRSVRYRPPDDGT